ncbi:acyltransferase family protein [Sphingomonas sp. S2-65]|uniref:acyltransferase family protein n=1 Tax=Sphingomonas sp. S2-65 TaxID=2903960 RepID=UPI001F21D2A5|nr:acyltransferase [Sphingomonas sp. S2-65]UYY58448.1 acyltransferase [Sphingomonas sp. S2-65]
MDRLRALWAALAAPAGHTPWLDGWRGLCILMVLAGHFVPQLARLAPLGVEMFFVLSGMLMAELLVIRRQPLATFVARRGTRVLPLLALYTGVVTLGMAIAALVGGAAVSWQSPMATLLFFSNYLAEPAPLLEHSWSLAVEEHSYLLLVLVAVASRRRAPLAAAIALLLAVAMAINGAARFYDGVPDPVYLFWRSDVRAASVLFAFALRLAIARVPDGQGGAAAALLSPLCLVCAVACMPAGGALTPLRLAGTTLFAGMAVNMIPFAVPAFRRLLSMPVLTRLGTLSFSLYLWQQPLFLATKGDFPAVVAVPILLLLATWSYLRVEAPARRFLNARLPLWGSGARVRGRNWLPHA